MGVAGLWDLLQHTSETRSLTHLAVVDGFEKNISGLRGYRIGIDASIWFFHAKSGREGENPELRLIFFRLAKLLSEPFLPLFVFDGPKRPTWKRGIQISKKPHWMIHGVKTMINAFGFEWRQAPGEAEAELAYLNRVGVIDGILSDDVDNFLFGALTVIRNPGRGLTGNISNPAVNLEGKDDGNHVRIFSARKMAEDESVGLTRAGFILIGLLSGGDYEEKDLPGSKLMGCGTATAHALARCGFGEELVNAFNVLSPPDFQHYLHSWREAMRQELRTNSRGLLVRKQAKLANSIPDAFPNLKIIKAYVQPVTSESEALASGGLSVVPPPKITWPNEHSLASLARFCEEKFEWGTMVIIPKRFRSLLWHGSVIRILRRAMLDLDRGRVEEGSSWKDGHVISTERPMSSSPPPSIRNPPKTPTKNRLVADSRGGAAVGTPSKMITKYFADVTLNSPQKPSTTTSDDEDETDDIHPLISKIFASTQKHPQTDYMLEYRVEVDPHQLIHLTQSGIEGIRDEPVADDGGDDGSAGDDDSDDGKRKTKTKPKVVDPFSHHRIWVPASMLIAVEKDLVEVFEEGESTKRSKKAAKGMKRAKTIPAPTLTKTKTGKEKPVASRTKSAPTARSRDVKRLGLESDDDAEEERFDLNGVSDASSDSGDDQPGTTTSFKPKPSFARAGFTGSSSVRVGTTTMKASIVDIVTQSRPTATRPDLGDDEDPFGEPVSRAPSKLKPHAFSNTTMPSSKLKTKPKARARVISKVETSDWEELFPSAPKTKSPLTTSSSLSSVNPASKSSTKRQLLSDREDEEDNTDTQFTSTSTQPPAPKSPRKTKEQKSPIRSPSKPKTWAMSRQALPLLSSPRTILPVPKPRSNENVPLNHLGLPLLSSDSDSDDSHSESSLWDKSVKKNSARNRSTSPTPRKGSATLRSLSSKLRSPVAIGKGKNKTVEVLVISSDEDDNISRKPLLSLTTTGKLTAGILPVATNKGVVNPTKRQGDEKSKAGSSSQHSVLPMRVVKMTPSTAPKAKRVNTAILNVIDLTTP